MFYKYVIQKQRNKLQNKELKFMLIDVHNHSMPGVDDGSQDSDMTFQMLQMAYEEGIRDIILTPHYKSAMEKETTQKRYAGYRRACLLAGKVSPRLKLYLGEELYYDSKMIQRLREGRALTLNGTQYVLVEFPFYVDYPYIRQAVRDLWAAGYFPVLAHIERYEALKKMERVEELVELGAYIQVNAGSVTGKAGFWTKHYLLKLIRNNLVHLVGTDAHNVSSRPPQMAECAAYLKKKAGSGKALKLCSRNARKILKGEKIGE